MTFLLPGAARRPSGGFKVVYEYANGLAARGHDVTVVHAAGMPGVGAARLTAGTRRVLLYGVRRASQTWRPTRWFEIHSRVRMLWVHTLRPRLVPDADAVVATWWQTAELLADWPEAKGRKYYLLQHLEKWGGPSERVLATWRMPLEKIVISRWLEQTAYELGEHAHYIPNGLDFATFSIDIRPAERKPTAIAMLYHEYDWKGSRDGIAALQIAKATLPGLHVELFGIWRRPRGLPGWIAYQRDPPQSELRAIYNRAAIYVAPSWTEGWSLSPTEALACGCALVCTDIGGHREYAIQGRTALMSEPQCPVALARNIVRLSSDTAMRLRLSAQGHEFIKRFTWRRAVEQFEAVLGLPSAQQTGVGRSGVRGRRRHGAVEPTRAKA